MTTDRFSELPSPYGVEYVNGADCVVTFLHAAAGSLAASQRIYTAWRVRHCNDVWYAVKQRMITEDPGIPHYQWMIRHEFDDHVVVEPRSIFLSDVFGTAEVEVPLMVGGAMRLGQVALEPIAYDDYRTALDNDAAALERAVHTFAQTM